MDAEGIAHRLEAAIHANVKKRPFWKLYPFTPSIKMGRRYVGIEVDGKLFSVTIEVEEA
jgi:hypothetical protein